MLVFYLLLISLISLQTISAHTNRVVIEFRITGYNNTNLRLPDGKSCTSSFINPFSSHSPPKCRFQFEIYIPGYNFQDGAADGKLGSVYLNNTGQLPEESRDYWGYGYNMTFTEVPPGIHVRAKHSGWVHRGVDGPILTESKVTTVDDFDFPFKDLPLPTIDNEIKLFNLTHLGNTLNTSLSVSISINCISSPRMDESFCDLSCTRSSLPENVANCMAQSTGHSYICNYVSEDKVDRCERCPYGVIFDTYCQEWKWTMVLPRFEALRQLTQEDFAHMGILILFGVMISAGGILILNFCFE